MAVSAERREWQRDESLLVLHLYCRTPFGKLHQHNPEIIKLADVIGRTPSAIAMKAVNFAHLDPNLDRNGLSSVSRADKALWEEFLEDSTHVALAAEDLYEQRMVTPREDNIIRDFISPEGPTESRQEVTVRRVQRFFRNSVIISYENKCAISGLSHPELLVASHIIPWKSSESRRADPTNGIALNNLYDRAFDRGLITFDEDWRVCLSYELKNHLHDSKLTGDILAIEGKKLIMPKRFHPDQSALSYHRESIFRG